MMNNFDYYAMGGGILWGEQIIDVLFWIKPYEEQYGNWGIIWVLCLMACFEFKLNGLFYMKKCKTISTIGVLSERETKKKGERKKYYERIFDDISYWLEFPDFVLDEMTCFVDLSRTSPYWQH